jgi:ABC-type antimicrobial peptide transport system permease subunit
MERFLKRHENRIIGTIAGIDRILFRGSFRSLEYIQGVERYLSHQSILYKDSLDQSAILSGITTIEEQLSEQMAPRRFQTLLLTLFSLIALTLASIGIYGVMHYSVVNRRHEIGIRIALGLRFATCRG